MSILIYKSAVVVKTRVANLNSKLNNSKIVFQFLKRGFDIFSLSSNCLNLHENFVFKSFDWIEKEMNLQSPNGRQFLILFRTIKRNIVLLKI